MSDGTPYALPLIASPQTLSISLAGVTYQLTFDYRDTTTGSVVPQCVGGWFLSIDDANGNPLVYGIPLVTGCDLLARYPDKNFGGALVVQTAGDPAAVPTFTNLGSNANVFFIPTVS